MLPGIWDQAVNFNRQNRQSHAPRRMCAAWLTGQRGAHAKVGQVAGQEAVRPVALREAVRAVGLLRRGPPVLHGQVHDCPLAELPLAHAAAYTGAASWVTVSLILHGGISVALTTAALANAHAPLSMHRMQLAKHATPAWQHGVPPHRCPTRQ